MPLTFARFTFTVAVLALTIAFAIVITIAAAGAVRLVVPFVVAFAILAVGFVFRGFVHVLSIGVLIVITAIVLLVLFGLFRIVLRLPRIEQLRCNALAQTTLQIDSLLSIGAHIGFRIFGGFELLLVFGRLQAVPESFKLFAFHFGKA